MTRRWGVLSTVVLVVALALGGCADGASDPRATLVDVLLLDDSGHPASARDVQVMVIDREPEQVGDRVTYLDVASARTRSDGRASLRDVDDDEVRDFVVAAAPGSVRFLVVAFDEQGRGWNCRFRRAAAVEQPAARPLAWAGPTPTLVLRPDGVCTDSTVGAA